MSLVATAKIGRNSDQDVPKQCPCCSGLQYEDCCLPIISGKDALTAEALVRSRYTAFVVKSLDHVENTHASEIKNDFNRAEAERLADECEWKSLRINKATETGDEAEVEYIVQVGREGVTHTKATRSQFRRENNQWFYVSTKAVPLLDQAHSQKVGRNDPCPCASGKKFKKCCGVATLSH
jgi:SEC-C motif domain protein